MDGGNEGVCAICQNKFNDEKFVHVKKIRLKALIGCGRERNDGMLYNCSTEK